MKVLDHGVVNLVNFMGGDDAVVASARVSNGALYENASKGTEKDAKLISYLLNHRHGTPFEHSVFTFYIKCPIFVAREWMRHRIGSYNEVSGRYTEFDPEFYIPEHYRLQGQTNKQGSFYPTGKDIVPYNLEDWDWMNTRDVQAITKKAYEVYKLLLARGIAKEMARMILPVNLYTQFYFTVNARALMNFLSLRMGEDAQFEIQRFAEAVDIFFEDKMPLTHAAWEANNRVAP